MLGAIDFFLPYFPLEASNLQDLFAKRLHNQAEQLQGSDAANLTWSPAVVEFLLSKVQQLACPYCFSIQLWIITIVNHSPMAGAAHNTAWHGQYASISIHAVLSYLIKAFYGARLTLEIARLVSQVATQSKVADLCLLS